MKVIKAIYAIAGVAVILMWNSPGRSDEQGQKPAFPEATQIQQEETVPDDPYASWREWFRAHEQDAVNEGLPEWRPPRMETLGESEVTVFDPLTREVRRGSLRELFPQAFDARGQFVPFMEESRSDERNPLDAFTVGEIIEDPSQSPWKVNCKLLISANGGVGHGSGILIDGNHVLTAGHCVYNIDLDEWVDMIEVIPAYDEGVRPFGTAYSAQMFTWTGWTQAHDWNWDMAVIKLDRPVGAITGWFPYDYNTDNNWYFSHTFHSTGYPVTSPFNGVRLNYRTGPFDSANVNILYELDTTAYGGMSGGGVYYRSGVLPFTRTVHAVASHGFGGYGGFNRMTSTKWNAVGSYIWESRPDTLDVAALGCKVFPESLLTGESIDSLYFYLYNPGQDTLTNVSLSVTLYISTNAYISTADVYVGTRLLTGLTLSSGESEKIVWSMPQPVPWNVTAGRKWMGVVVNYTDGNSSNNSTSYDDADTVIIGIAPPTQAGEPTPSNGSTNVGVNANLTWQSGLGAASHNVYFGETNPPPFRVNQTSTLYDPPGSMFPGHVYYWRIDEVNSAGTTQGVVWHFTTTFPVLPGQAGDPIPANNTMGVPVTTTVSWSAGLGFTESFDVYFGTTNPPPFVTNMFLQEYNPPGNLALNIQYFWRIDSRNASGVTTGNLWTFRTGDVVPLEAPSELTIQIVESVAPSLAVLRWKHVAFANQYQVHRSTILNFTPGPATLVATVPDTFWVDTSVLSSPETLRYYVITAGQ